MNVLIEFKEYNNIYNKFSDYINKTTTTRTKNILNGIIATYKNTKWIIGPMIHFDGYELYRPITIEIYLENDYYIYKIKNIKSVFEENIENELNKELKDTLFFDCHLNLFFIKFEEELDGNLFYDLNSYDILGLLNKEYYLQKVNLKCLDVINDDLGIVEDTGIITNSYCWNFNILQSMPPIPYLTIKNNSNLKLFSGSSVLDEDNNFVGIISYNYNDLIVTPLVSILRSLDYFYGNNLKIVNISINPVIRSIIKNNNVEYGLMVDNNYNANLCKYYIRNIINQYGIHSNEHNNIVSNYIQYSLLKRGTIIKSINNININEEGYLDKGNLKIPFKSYIWLLIIDNNINIGIYKNINKNTAINFTCIYPNNFNTINIKFKLENKNLGINNYELKYVKYNNKYLFELNETFIDIFKDIILNDTNLNKYVNNNKFNIKNNKILFGVELLYDIDYSIKIKIVHKLISIDNIKYYISKKSLKKYINKIL
jgi:hypothetical protein